MTLPLELTLELPGLPVGSIVAHAHGREALSEPWSFEALVLLPEKSGGSAAAGLLGAEATLRVGTELSRTGVVTRVDSGDLLGDGGSGARRITLTSRLALLARGRRSRAFFRQTARQIVNTVLGEAKLPCRWALQGATPAERAFCVQHQESDLAFVTRLLEAEGIFYFLEPGAGGDTVVLTDAPGAGPAIPGRAALPFRPARGLIPDEDVVTALEATARLTASAVVVRDYAYEKPGDDLSGRAGAGNAAVHEYPGRFDEVARGARLATVRLQERQSAGATLGGGGSCRRFAPGRTFQVTGHPEPALNGALVLTAIEHEAHNPALRSATERAPYLNRFEAAPAAAKLRPTRRTPRPNVAGVETAIVVGPPGEEIHTDADGRVCIRFHWDRESPRDDKGGCWVRVAAHPWAGGGWGQLLIPRVGQEVLVRFLDGDPDRPVVAGVLYNGEQAPPSALPADRTRMVWRSRSTPHGDGANEIAFEDTNGAERVDTVAQKDQHLLVKDSHAGRIEGAAALHVGRDRSRRVGEHQEETVGGSDAATVTGSQDIKVGAAATRAVTGLETLTVGGAREIKVGGGQTLLVRGGDSQAIEGARKTEVKRQLRVDVSQGRMSQVEGQRHRKIEKDRSLVTRDGQVVMVEKAARTTVSGNEVVAVEGALVEEVGLAAGKDSGHAETIGGKLTLTVAKDLAVTGKGKATWTATKLTVAVGGKIALYLDDKGTVKLSGKTIAVKGSAGTIGGKKVKKVGPGDASDRKGEKDNAKKKEDPKKHAIVFGVLLDPDAPKDGYLRFATGGEEGLKLPFSRGTRGDDGLTHFEVKVPWPEATYEVFVGHGRAERLLASGIKPSVILDDAAKPDGGLEAPLLIGPGSGELRLTLLLPADLPDLQDDTFVLTSDGGLVQEKSAAKDLVRHGSSGQIVFVGLDPTASYSLEIRQQGAEEPYHLFTGVPYAEIVAPTPPVGRAR